MSNHPLDETTTLQRRKRQRERFNSPDPEEATGEKWSLWKEILGIVIGVATVVVLGGVPLCAYLWEMGQNLATIQVRVTAVEQNLKRSDDDRMDRTHELNDRLVRIEQKVDHIAETQGRSK